MSAAAVPTIRVEFFSDPHAGLCRVDDKQPIATCCAASGDPTSRPWGEESRGRSGQGGVPCKK